MGDLFSFFDDSDFGRAAIQGSHIVHTIQAHGILGNYKEVISYHDRLETLLAKERASSSGASLTNQVAKTVAAAQHFVGRQAEETSQGDDDAVDAITVHIET